MSNTENDIPVSDTQTSGGEANGIVAAAEINVDAPFEPGEMDPSSLIPSEGISSEAPVASVATVAPPQGRTSPAPGDLTDPEDATPAEHNVNDPALPGDFDIPEIVETPPGVGEEPVAMGDEQMPPMGVIDPGLGSAGEHDAAAPAEQNTNDPFVAGDFAPPDLPPEPPATGGEAVATAGTAQIGLDATTPEGTASIFDEHFADEILVGNPAEFDFQGVQDDFDGGGAEFAYLLDDFENVDDVYEVSADHAVLPNVDTQADEIDAFLDLFMVDGEAGDSAEIDDITGRLDHHWDGGTSDFM